MVLPIAAMLAAVLLWAASYSCTRIFVQAMPASAVMLARMLVAVAILAPFSKKLLRVEYKKQDIKALAAMVVFMPCLYFLLESNALRFTTSSQAGVISGFVPLFVAVGAWIFLSEPISVLTFAGLLVSLAGVAGLTLLGNGAGTATAPLLGNALELGAMASAAANIVLIKRLSSRYSPWTMTALQVAAGTLFFLHGIPALTRSGAALHNPAVAGCLLFLGSFVSLGAFGMYNWGMCQVSTTRAAAFIYLIPVCAVFFGWTILGEKLNAAQIASAAAVILGVLASQRQKA